MTIGIYKLNFKNTDKVYIGQSKNIENRYTAHLRLLKLGCSSKKLLNAYKEYGVPSLKVLIECDVDTLTENETMAIEIFDSIKNGFNTINSQISLYINGENSSNAYHDNETYISAFLMLARGESREIISRELDISLGILKSISTGKNHKWLKSLYPDEYNELLLKHSTYSHKTNNTAEQQGIIYPEIISPEGVKYNVTSLRGFAREFGFHSSNLEQLLHGKLTTLKGWKLSTTTIKIYPQVLSPKGKAFFIPYNGARNFAKEHNMTPGNLSMLLSGKKSQYKGWTLVK